MSEELAVGIHAIGEDGYQGDPCSTPSLSASIAKILVSSTPLHAWTAHPKLNPNFVREEKEIFDRGTVAHALMLQGVKNAIVFDLDDWRKPEARRARDDARAEGKIPILRKHWSLVQDMVAAGKVQLAAHKEAANAFTAGKAEQTLIWLDHATDGTGVVCRARLDWLHDDYRFIDDYKSTGRDVDPSNIMGKVVDDWDIQESFYRRGVKAITGMDARFRFIAQENTAPFALAVIGFGPEIQWMGDAKVQRAIDLWAKCMTSNCWPGYADRIYYPELPKWVEEQEERRQLA